MKKLFDLLNGSKRSPGVHLKRGSCLSAMKEFFCLPFQPQNFQKEADNEVLIAQDSSQDLYHASAHYRITLYVQQ